VNIRAEPGKREALSEARRLGREFGRNAAELDLTGAFPYAHFDALFEAGLTRLTTAVVQGGQGEGLETAYRVVAEIAAGEPSTALILAMHYINHAAIRFGIRWGEAAGAAVVASARSGPALVNALQVEPEAGSPSYGTLPRSRARRTAEGWRLSGRKRYSTGCEGLAWMVVLALTDEPNERLGSFLVAHPGPGIRIEKTWNATGMRATGSHDVVFDDVFVPSDFAFDLNPAHPPPPRDPRLLAWFMTLIGAVYHGVARAARDETLRFAASFRPGDLRTPLSELPLVQDQLGEIEILIDTSERLLASIAIDADTGRDAGPSAGRVRHTVIENAIRAVDIAQRIAGQYGVSRDHALERHRRNVICGRTHAPNGALVRAAAARAALADIHAENLP
jgi:alkylation response protein AidB-like acyl-CoA dehydrogenase